MAQLAVLNDEDAGVVEQEAVVEAPWLAQLAILHLLEKASSIVGRICCSADVIEEAKCQAGESIVVPSLHLGE
jgi:hypothetical protein